MLEGRPYLTFDGVHFTLEGYELIFPCRNEGRYYVEEGTGNHYPTQDCIDRYKIRCGENYVPEIIPESPGCLDNDHRAGYGTSLLNIADLGMLDKSWVVDGVTQDEIQVLRALDRLVDSRGHRAMSAGRLGEEWTALRIGDMPFLQTLGPGDERALWGLAVVAGSEERFRAVITHPSLLGGITDEMTSIIASLGRVVLERTPEGDRYADAELIPRLNALLDGIS